jgi:hypothetical protein
LKQITEQQIRQRANEIGIRPAFPHFYDGDYVDEMSNGTLMKNGYCSGSTGITYRMWLIGQVVSGAKNTIPSDVLTYVDRMLLELAKAELEAEHNLNG